MAEKIGHSKRQLERHFQSALDTSPQAAFLSIRLSLAHHLVTTSDKSISHIAHRSETTRSRSLLLSLSLLFLSSRPLIKLSDGISPRRQS